MQRVLLVPNRRGLRRQKIDQHRPGNRPTLTHIAHNLMVVNPPDPNSSVQFEIARDPPCPGAMEPMGMGGSCAISHCTSEIGSGRPISIKLWAMWINFGRFSGRCWSICCRRRPRLSGTSKNRCIFYILIWEHVTKENRVWTNMYSLAKFANQHSILHSHISYW